MSASLLLQSGDVLTRLSLGNGALTIGRLPENDLTLESASIRPRHARIVPSPEGFLLENLNPTGRTMVNDQRIERRVLQHGDRVTLGDYSAVFASGEGRDVEPPTLAPHDHVPRETPEEVSARARAATTPRADAVTEPSGGAPHTLPLPERGSARDPAPEPGREPGGGTGPEPAPPPQRQAAPVPAFPRWPPAPPASPPSGTSAEPEPAREIDTPTSPAELKWHAAGGAEPLGYLQVVSGPLAGHVMTLGKPRTTLGFKGRRIAVVEHDRGHFRVRRLDSTRTVMLNGDPIGVTTTRLQPGDTLELADARLRFSRDRPEQAGGA